MAMESLIGQAGNDAHDDIRDVGMTYWQHEHDATMQKKSYQYQKQLNRQMADLAGEARRHSAMDMVAGLKAAGLSPALAHDTNFGGVTAGGSSPAPSTSAPPVPRGAFGRLALDALRYQQSERGLMDAQAQNLQAQAQKTNVETQNMRDANTTVSALASDHFGNILKSPQASQEDKAFATAMLSHPLSMGAMQGYDEFMSAYSKSSQALKDKLENDVRSKVAQSKLWDENFASKVAGLEPAQVDNLREHTNNLIADTAVLQLELSRQNADIDLVKKQQNLIDAQIREIDQIIKKTKHNDLA